MDILSLVSVPDEYVVEIEGQIYVHKKFIDLLVEQNQCLEDKPSRFDYDVLIDQVLEFARENPRFKNSQVRPHLEQDGKNPSSAIVANVLSKMGGMGLLVKTGERSLSRWSLPEES